MPLLTNTPGNGSGTQPVRLKLSGTTKFSGRLVDEQQGVGGGALFLGDLSLQDLKINQLRLTRHLSGQLRVDSGGAELRAMGRRPDEALHAAVSMPINLGALVRGEASPAPPPRGISGRVSLRRGQLYLGTHLSEETGAVFLAAKELTLDELELGSLRGETAP